LEGLVVLRSPGKDSATIVDVSVDNDEDGGISGARDLEFAQVTFKLDVAQGEEELSVVVVEDLVRDAGSVDAAEDLDVRTTVGCRKVTGESTVEGDGEQTLEEGGWNVVALEFYFVFVTPLDGGCEDGIDSEQEEVMVTSGSVRGCCVGRRRSHFHGAEASRHSLEAVIGEELELQE
jgi:hypothetical protein